MKYHIIIILLAGIGLVSAQQPPPDGPMGPDQRPPGGDKMARAFFPPELVMRNQITIGLTAEQQSAIREEMQKTMPRFYGIAMATGSGGRGFGRTRPRANAG
jgi:hypothetical protein